jgi:hypothetical protein
VLALKRSKICLSSMPTKIVVGAHEFQLTRGREERARLVALRMNASHKRGSCERSEEQSFHVSF